MIGWLALIAAALVGVPATAPAEVAAPAAQRVSIPFDPPLGRRLVYRQQRIVENEAGTRRREVSFALEFRRSGPYLIMILSPAAGGAGAPRLPPPLRRQEFRMGPGAEILGMEDEPAYWAALRTVLEQPETSGAEDPEKDGRVWAMQRTRALPLRDRMRSVAELAYWVLAFAGERYTRGPVEASDLIETVVGPVQGIERMALEQVSDEAVTISYSRTIPTEALQAAIGRLAEGFGSRPPTIGSRLVSNDSIRTAEVDRRTGLVRTSRTLLTLVTEQDGRTLRTVSTEILERVDPPLSSR